MTRFDHDALIAKRNIMQMCVHMSAAYIAPILDDAELMLVSRHQTQNAVTRRIVEILTPMASGAAFQVIREVRAALLPSATDARAAAWNKWVENTTRPALHEWHELEKHIASYGAA